MGFLGWLGVGCGIALARKIEENPSQKYLKFSDQAIWLSLSVG
jgi:hypothetical protein